MTGTPISRYALSIAFGLALAGAATAAPGPDLAVTKTCTLGANQSVTCTVTIKNIGNIPSVAPLHVTDTVNPVAAGTLYTGAGGTLPFGCGPAGLYTSVGPVQCNANTSLAPGQSGTLLVAFKLPQGGVLYNCATASQAQNAATLPDPNLANNTGCTKIQVGGGGSTGKPDIQVTKSCTPYPNIPHAVKCSVTVANVGNAVSIAPFTLTEFSSSGYPAGMVYKGLEPGSTTINCSQGANTPFTGPITCTGNYALNFGNTSGASASEFFIFSGPPGKKFMNCAKAVQGPGQPAETVTTNNQSCVSVAFP